MIIDEFIDYIRGVRRYSARTQQIYSDVLEEFSAFASGGGELSSDGAEADRSLLGALTPEMLRSYEVQLMDDSKVDARTVNLHLSVLSSFCKYLIKNELLQSNPVRLLPRPKMSKRLPEFYRAGSMDDYLARTEHNVDEDALEFLRSLVSVNPSDKTAIELYDARLRRMIISILFQTGMRRSELLKLDRGSVDFTRKVINVRGKGDKMREIPLTDGLCKEILLYLQSVDTMVGLQDSPDTALLVDHKGLPLYPVYIDRVIKSEFAEVGSITGRKSPHVLRHTLATELLNEGAGLNSIKELLGHSSLAATQVYTHNSIEKLKNVYKNAHPRAKSGGSYGD